MPEPINVIIDSWAITSINKVDKNTLNLKVYEYLPSNLAYRLKSKPEVLIIGAGGGHVVMPVDAHAPVLQLVDSLIYPSSVELSQLSSIPLQLSSVAPGWIAELLSLQSKRLLLST